MTKIHFIINPISGKGKHNIDYNYLRAFFQEKEYDLKVAFSKYKKHAISLTESAIEAGADIVVACGGDGTIHEVATQIVGKDISFGIIPVGSGNGLASNLSIPKDIEQAILKIKTGRILKMDVGSVNGEYFFSNMGFGIDATIIESYEKSGKHKLVSYIKAALNSALQYRTKKMKVSYNGISKEADGLLDYVMVPKINFIKQLTFGLYVLLKKTETFRKTDYVQTQKIEVEVLDQKKNGLQLDGEFYEFKTNSFQIEVKEGALKVIC
jgi:diacylglycerol kinase family enzyme